MKTILTEEGFLEKERNAWKRYYYLRDHLGSTRVVIDESGTGVQETRYYPFGTYFAESTNQEKQPYKYNGKELDRHFGLDLYDYGARFYDPLIGRFTTPDPLSEKYYSVSPYSYCKNNPVNRIDPDGKDDIFYNQKGDEINRLKTKEPDRFYLEHKEGNVTIGDNTYYQGLTKESFFGDRGNENKIELFEKVDTEAMGSDEKIVQTVDEHTKKGETQIGFLIESPEDHHYDYKNKVLGTVEGGNMKTAYMYKGLLLNRNEAGNVFWGATAGKLGFGIAGAIVGVQGFSLLNEGKFDEKAEQKAIVRGMLIYDVYGKKK